MKPQQRKGLLGEIDQQLPRFGNINRLFSLSFSGVLGPCIPLFRYSAIPLFHYSGIRVFGGVFSCACVHSSG